MAYTYRNSKGTTYVLHSRETTLKNGLKRTLYYFGKAQEQGSVNAVPAGFTVVEIEGGAPVLKKVGDTRPSVVEDSSKFFSPALIASLLGDSEDEQYETVSETFWTKTSVPSMLEAVEEGVSYAHFERLATDLDVGESALAKLLRIRPSILEKRKQAGRFTSTESERILRYSLLLSSAGDLFEGNMEQAAAWLSAKNRALQHHTPLEYAATEIGAREVENLIVRLEHGVLS